MYQFCSSLGGVARDFLLKRRNPPEACAVSARPDAVYRFDQRRYLHAHAAATCRVSVRLGTDHPAATVNDPPARCALPAELAGSDVARHYALTFRYSVVRLGRGDHSGIRMATKQSLRQLAASQLLGDDPAHWFRTGKAARLVLNLHIKRIVRERCLIG